MVDQRVNAKYTSLQCLNTTGDTVEPLNNGHFETTLVKRLSSLEG